MITGFNTDIKHNEKVYHIQTEDKGLQNPYIESLVYVGGEILASKKTSYAEQAGAGVDEKWIGSLMEQQHRTMIAAIKRGRFDVRRRRHEVDAASDLSDADAGADARRTAAAAGRSTKNGRSTRSSSTISPPRPRASTSSCR